MKRMDLQHTGSNELIYIQTDKVSLVIKGRASHPIFQEKEAANGQSTLKVFCEICQGLLGTMRRSIQDDIQ